LPQRCAEDRGTNKPVGTRCNRAIGVPGSRPNGLDKIAAQERYRALSPTNKSRRLATQNMCSLRTSDFARTLLILPNFQLIFARKALFNVVVG
jgi:hypothetical protein